MFNPSEKAYCLALLALKRKDYRTASDHFDRAASGFKTDREFNLYRETTRLLLAVKREIAVLEKEDKLEIEEAFPNGQETELR
ncbi:MAG: hypothetical protein DRP47_04880 [Candidatus Zixiibacteriota bacterium]|nr:MAG: hypothetical protein DRP47_04880 [candidate division Zixibacteria bacterium]